MRKQNIVLILIVSILIVLFMFIATNDRFRHQIRQKVLDKDLIDYNHTSKINFFNDSLITVLTHTIINVNDHILAYSIDKKQIIKLPSIYLKNHQISLNLSQSCSACH